MLPKSKRITKKDFIGSRPKVVFRGTYVDISIFPNNTTKFTCIISKKRIKNATERNKVRRRISHILSLCETKNKNLIFVYPKHTTISANHKLLSNEIKEAFATL